MAKFSSSYGNVLLFVLVLLSNISFQLATCGSIVKFLPGFQGPLPFVLETGYVGVGEKDDVQTFYYFIESENNPKEDPLMLWLTGGPGCSALSGLVFEIGPLEFIKEEYNGSLPNLILKPHSWTKVSNIIFVDLPVFTGFTYATTEFGSKRSDTILVHQVHQFLRKWLVDHPKFQSNEVYIGGDSYSGITVPAIVQEIAQGNEKGVQPWINLQGYLLGNAVTTEKETNYKIPFAHGMGLISDELYESLQKNCNGDYVNVETRNVLCSRDMSSFSEVCDPNGRWYLSDSGSGPGDLLLITGRALSHATAGLHPAASYRASPDCFMSINSGGRTSLAYRLMPQGNAILDCSPIAAAGHVITQSYVPISVSQFMDDLAAEELLGSRCDNNDVAQSNANKDPSLRSVLSDPLSGSFLEDAMLVSCGHSFGGLTLRRVIETSRCTLCNVDIETGSLIPNLALRAAAAAVKHEDDRRLFRNAALRKRRKEMGEPMDPIRRMNRENGDFTSADGLQRGVQYPFSVNEKVIIKGNRRTPEKFVGKEAVITSQCLNGWYLLKIIGSGENVRLQYRSLRKLLNTPTMEDQCQVQPVQNSSS